MVQSSSVPPIGGPTPPQPSDEGANEAEKTSAPPFRIGATVWTGEDAEKLWNNLTRSVARQIQKDSQKMHEASLQIKKAAEE
jgi:hypothetical protein